MPGTAVIDSGNYSLKIATGFQVDAFVLDDTLKGVLDNTSYVLDGTTEFADVMSSTTNAVVLAHLLPISMRKLLVLYARTV